MRRRPPSRWGARDATGRPRQRGEAPRRPAQAATAKGRGATKGSRTKAVQSRFHEETRLGEAYDARMLLRLWPFVRPQGKHLAVSLALLVVTALLALLRPLIMRD